MRRLSAEILVILGLVVLGAHADDYLSKKEWKNWSKDDCKKVLEQSPWSFGWTRTLVPPDGAAPIMTGNSSDNPGRDVNPEEHYYVQDRSSIPVREAYIRQMQILGEYNKMDDAHKKAFDAQANNLLSKPFDDVILIHVEFGSTVPSFERQMALYWKNIPADTIPANIFLTNQKGDHIPPVKFESLRNGEHSFDLYFPRRKGNDPVIQDADKSFSIEFRTPPVGNPTPVHMGHDSGPGEAAARPTFDMDRDTSNDFNPALDSKVIAFGVEHIVAEFKLDKMTWKGKPSF
jgi:hypothetical protein